MALLRRVGSVSARLAKALVVLVAFLLILVGLAVAAIETGWAKNRLRDLIVRQANNYLTATLTIGRLEGSLFRGLQLGDITLARDGRTLIHIDEVALAYSIRELIDQGTVIRSIRLTHPYVVGAKLPDGRWDLGALVKRESREQERTGPNRPIRIEAIEVVDGHVYLRDPLDFGAAHVPTDFQRLNASFSFAYVPVRWTIDFQRVSWIGHSPELSIDPLSGRFGRGPTGWFFQRFTVNTARSRFVLDGTILPGPEGTPTVLDLKVAAPRLAFQEWSGVLRGLANIAIESSLDTSLKGPTTGIETDINLAGTGGAVRGHVRLDTSVPGWLAKGIVDVERLNLARWMNRADRPSDITGHVTFDLALELGRHFPRGRYTFDGPHAMYMNYGGDEVHARGDITSSDVLIADAKAVAYGAAVTTHDSSIALDEPFTYRFRGTTTGIDLRRVPAQVPVPHVDSLLTFDYDVTGTFTNPYLVGRAAFADSQFLGAAVRAGTVGSIDTQQKPFRYTGDGEVDDISMRRFGEALDIGWMRDPRYAGTISGHFWVDGTGAGPGGATVSGGGRLRRAQMFKGTLANAEVSIAIAGGSLRAAYDGRLETIDPSVPFADSRFAASLNGTGRVTATVRDVMARTTTLADYDVEGTLELRDSDVRGVHMDRGRVDATLRDSTLTLAQLDIAGGPIEGSGRGTVALVEGGASDFQYQLTRADLGALRTLHGQDVEGVVATTGRLTGPTSALHLAGNGAVTQLKGFDLSALSIAGEYDATIPSGDPSRAIARLNGRGEFLTVFGQAIQDATGTISYDADRVGFDVRLVQQQGRNGQFAGSVQLHRDRREASILALTVTLGRAPWRLITPAPTVAWNDDGFTMSPVQFADPNNDQRIGIEGTWRADGAGALHLTATHVFLDTLQTAFERPTRYGGTLDLDATIGGTRDDPRTSGRLTVTSGRVERVSYERFQATFSSAGQMFDVDARLDQAPGVWLTAAGKLPLALFNRDLPERPVDLTIKSSTISLGLIEGVTDVVRNVTGEIRLDVRTIGTSHDPHLAGSVLLTNAGFLVTSTGAQYKNVRGAFVLATDKIGVETLHVEDSEGHPLDLHGSLGTHELRVGDVEIEMTGRRFEVMRNELGRVDLDASLQITGRFEAPRITGNLTVASGTVRVDEILARTMFQPYPTEPAPAGESADPLVALNPWQRLGLDIALHVPGTLRLQGENVQVSPGTPIGLGDINLTTTGDLYLYKDPGQALYVTGSFDSIRGTYAFQGRRFDVTPNSSINFRGDLNPEIYVTVTRVIQGVETRVSIFGEMQKPELRLASTPPLDASDILSLIIFNTSTNQLTAPEQQQLLVRAGTLAAGFIAGQLLGAVQSETGLNILELETTGDFGGGPKFTIEEQVGSNLVARFSRQFGPDPYDEATIEYYLSRILRLRATFSDAQTLNQRSPFRRVERAGIDLLLFFSF